MWRCTTHGPAPTPAGAVLGRLSGGIAAWMRSSLRIITLDLATVKGVDRK
jgi:hypothetical protein